MARTKMEEKLNDSNFDIDLSEDLPMKEVKAPVEENKREETIKSSKKIISINDDSLVSPLRNERVTVRYIPKIDGIWGNNPKHVLAGGMAETATRTFVVPRLQSGAFVNVLTDKEKAFLENFMGLEYNALSIYKKIDNFWDDGNDIGISRVRLTKQDNYFNLSNPEDYIKYKILLANKDVIAPSLKVLRDSPKASYQFVIIEEGEENKAARSNMTTTMACYKEFGKVEDDKDILKTIIETIDARPLSAKTNIEFLQTKANELIQRDSRLFLSVITDPLLKTKVLINKSIEAGLISKRGNHLYLRESNQPLCEDGEDPTLNIAARYLNSPKRQEIKFMLEAKLKQ
jgi:hypothetical protein